MFVIRVMTRLKMHRISIKPLSINQAFQGRRFKNSLYKAYERDVLCQLKPLKMPKPPLSVYYEFGLSSKNADLDNHIKCFQDILQKRYGFNDKNIYHMIAFKTDVAKGEEYIEFCFGHYE